MTLQEIYGQTTLKALKGRDWAGNLPAFEKLEREGLREASLALGQLHTGSDDAAALAHFRQGAEGGCSECAWGVAALLGHEYVPDIAGEDAAWFKYRHCLAAGGLEGLH